MGVEDKGWLGCACEGGGDGACGGSVGDGGGGGDGGACGAGGASGGGDGPLARVRCTF